MSKHKIDKAVRLISPVMEVKFANILQSFDYNNAGKPKYSLDAMLESDDPATKEFVEKLTKLAQDAFDKAMENMAPPEGNLKDKYVEARKNLSLHLPFKDDYKYDKEAKSETNEKTGKIVFKMAKNASYKDSDTQEVKHVPSPDLYDAKRNKITNPDFKEVPWGTKLRVQLLAKQYHMPATNKAGITLKLIMCQIVELPEQGCAFDEVDGYETNVESTADVTVPETPFVENTGDEEDDF